MTPRLGAKRVQQIIALVWAIEAQTNLQPLINLLAT
jgi:hypothetical protein